MPRGSKKYSQELKGQIELFEFSTNPTNYVVQSNLLVSAKQTQKLNSIKLLRAAIMQVVVSDEEFKPYIVSVNELAKLLNISQTNIYRDIESIVDDIMKNPVQFKSIEGNKVKWVSKPWVKECGYETDVGVYIQLNDALRPYLISLKSQYTQYQLENIIPMKSVYSIRIFELLLSKVKTKTLPMSGKIISVTMTELRECCDCEDKLLAYSNFRMRVLDTAVNEINKNTTYRVEYTPVRKGRKVYSIDFHINSCYH